jgi:hypothetical protein
MPFLNAIIIKIVRAWDTGGGDVVITVAAAPLAAVLMTAVLEECVCAPLSW